jgi:hypothetical protein
MPPPENLPHPLVFGPSFPDFTMTTKNGQQVFTSRTNQNLFFSDWDFTDQGTYTMAALLKWIGTTEECMPLIFDASTDLEDGSSDWHFADEPRWDASDAFSRLLGFCDSSAEQQRFLLEWCKAQYARDLEEAFLEYVSRVGSEAATRAVGGFGYATAALMDVVFDFPALIPETWLNAVRPERTDAEIRHLAENPQRVDFVLFAQARKCVIEIDGPSHYAEFNEQGYLVSEELYSRNLAIERSLRRQGWDIFRFANIELRRASGEDFARLVHSAQVPGFDCRVYGSRVVHPAADADDVTKAFVEIPF